MNAKSKNVAVVEENTAIAAPIAPESVSPIQQLALMKEAGLTPADMKDMLAVQKDYDAMQAEKLFNQALAAFKSEDILLVKDKQVSFQTTKGLTEYKHATLGSIVSIATPFMSKHGLSHRWKMAQGEQGMITVTFILTHVAGHSEETSLQASPDQSGGKNSIQAVSSTVSYLERYTFLAGTGLAVEDQNDDDAQTAIEPVELISNEQVMTIDSMMRENELNWELFWAWVNKKFVGVDAIEKFPSDSYDVVIKKINQSIEAKKSAQ